MYNVLPDGLISQGELVRGVGNKLHSHKSKPNNPTQPKIVNLFLQGTIRNLKEWSQSLTCSKGGEARDARKAGSDHTMASSPLSNRLDVVGPLNDRVTGSDLYLRNVTW